MKRTLGCLAAASLLTLSHGAAAAETIEPIPVTSIAPTVVDECGIGLDTVTLPEIEGLEYRVALENPESGADETIVLPAGELPGALVQALSPEIVAWGADLDTDDEPPLVTTTTIEVVAQDGHVLSDGSATQFQVDLDATPCDSLLSPTVEVGCAQATFTNPADNPALVVEWVESDTADEDPTFTDEGAYEEGSVVVEPGSSASIETQGGGILWIASGQEALEALEDTLSFGEDEFSQRRAAARESVGGEASALRAEAAADPDPTYVVTAEDIALFDEAGHLYDLIDEVYFAEDFVEAPADCDGDGTSAPTPVIPTVVQTG